MQLTVWRDLGSTRGMVYIPVWQTAICILWLQAMYQQLRLEPYAVHTTFQYGGTEGKRHRLREAMLFIDPPDYYNPPGK